MAVVFISDIHILNREDPAYRSLLRLFETGLQPGDTLVLGGDIFDLWVGKHAFFRRDFPEFVPALRRVSDRGCALHWIEGNHDFHLGGAFADVPGLKVHPDELDLHLSGEHLHFQHGDRVDRADLGYLRLRRILRNSLVRFLLENLPEGAIRWIARTLSGASRGHREPSPGVRAAFRRFAQEKAQAGVRFLFLGHCHDPDDFAYESGSSRIFYSNCGYPKRDNAYLRWAPGMREISRVSFLTADSKPLLK